MDGSASTSSTTRRCFIAQRRTPTNSCAPRAVGGWGYGFADKDRWSDNSNAQYAVLGLNAAVKLGRRIPEKTWNRLTDYFLRQSGPYGGTGYQERGAPTASMTCAAVSSLAIAAMHMDEKDTRRPAIRARIARHTEWLSKHWWIRAESIDYYAAYSLERAMGLTQQTRLGTRDWYREGAPRR